MFGQIVHLEADLDVSAWLRELGMERYCKAFQDNDIDAEILPELSESDLSELGINSLGHRKKLIKAIAAMTATGYELRGSKRLANEHRTSTQTPPRPRAEADRRQLTVLFSDLVGSTELSTRFDPEDMRDIIRAYQDSCAGVIARFEGFIAKFMGDGVLAYYGYPIAHEDEGERAVRTGLEIVDVVSKLSTPTGDPLAVRVGIATGLVVVGDLIGEGSSQEQTVVGETPNLAARLQDIAEPGSVIISAKTRQLLGGTFELADLGGHPLKGLAEPVNAWRVLGESQAEGRFDALHATELTPMIGRASELSLLLNRWQSAKNGEGQVVLLSGEPGIGKSRLTQAFRERLSEEPHMRLSYHCSPYHTNSALHPVIDQLRRAADIQANELADNSLSKLEELLGRKTDIVPLIASLCAIPIGERYPPLNLSPMAQRARTLEALLSQLESHAEIQPVIMLVEDAHWIDPTTAELIDQTIERIRHLPVFLLVTFRPELDPPWAARSHTTTLALNRLVRDQGMEIIDGLNGGKLLPTEVKEQILIKTDGIPLFVEELTKVVLESGLLKDIGNCSKTAGELPPLAIPATLHDSLMARLDRLAPVKEVAQIGAVMGREFSHTLVAAVSPLGEDELQDALDQLVAAELVFQRGTPPEVTFVFKHALVQDAAYQSLLKSKRQQLHARIAQELEENFPVTVESEPELLARHLSQGGQTENAVKYWHMAGQLALAKSGTAEAIAHLQSGLDVLTQMDDDEQIRLLELDIQLTLAGALAAAKGHGTQDTKRSYARAIELSRELRQPQALYPALDGLMTFHFSRAEFIEAIQLGEEFLGLAEANDDDAAKVVAHMNLGIFRLSHGELETAQHQLQSALALYDPERHASLKTIYSYDPKVLCLGYLAWVQLSLGKSDRALQTSRDSVTRAEEISHPLSLGFALHRSITVHQLRRDISSVENAATTMQALACEQGFVTYSISARLYQGWALVQRNSIDDGIPLLCDSLDALRAIKDEDFFPHTISLVAEALAKRGEYEGALELLQEALHRVENNKENWFEAEVHRLIGEVTVAQECETSVEGNFVHALRVAKEQKAGLWELRAGISLARYWRDHGKRDEARDLLAPICSRFTEGLETADFQDAAALLNELS